MQCSATVNSGRCTHDAYIIVIMVDLRHGDTLTHHFCSCCARKSVNALAELTSVSYEIGRAPTLVAISPN